MLRVQSGSGDARLWLDAGRIVWAEGVRVFDDDEAWLKNPERLSGVPAEDLAVAIDEGMQVDEALDQACMAVATYLARLVDQGWEQAAWTEGAKPPQQGFPLPWPAMRLLSRGLRELRHPDAVAAALAPHWDAPLRVRVPGEAGLRGLDVVSLRTLKIATHLETLGELIVQSGRGQVERTRHSWRAIDLLLQLELLQLGPKEAPFEGTSALPDLSLTAPWRPQHQPELLVVSGPLIEFLPPVDKETTNVLPDMALEDDEEAPEPPNMAETDLQRLCALCVEVNPLAVLDLDADRLHGVLTLTEVQQAFERGAARLAPSKFEGSPMEGTARALSVLLDDARESLQDGPIVSVWLRDLRRHSRIDTETTDADRREAEANHRRAKELAGGREWEKALGAAVRATRLDPASHRYRIVQVFCLVALRRLSPANGVLNLDALELADARETAQAQVTAARLLKAARRPDEAKARFKLALELDPTRRDAKAELKR